MTTEDDIPGLGDFGRKLLALEADPAFETLRTAQSRTNMFRIVGTTDRERWHSAFWAWIFDPDGSHGLGDFALHRLFAHAADDEGNIKGIRLCPDTDGGDFVRWKVLRTNSSVDNLKLCDLMKWRVSDAAVAPGPLSDFSEVTSKSVVKKVKELNLKGGDASRFDILLVLQGANERSDIQAIGTVGLRTLVIVIEMKVRAKYDAKQLERYSGWVHSNPTVADLSDNKENYRFISRVDELSKVVQQHPKSSDTWGIGLFISPYKPENLLSPWIDIRLAALINDILEPFFVHPVLDPYSKELVRNYITMITCPGIEEDEIMIAEEYKKLVRSLYKKHEGTFQLIAKVLQAESEEPQKTVGSEIANLDSDEDEVRRSLSLRPQSLLDAGLVVTGDRLEHRPVKNQKTKAKPFDMNIIVSLSSGDRTGFELIQGPPEIDDLKGKRFTSSGLLKEVYKRFGSTFSGSGNAGFSFVSGKSKGKRLDDVYQEARDAQET